MEGRWSIVQTIGRRPQLPHSRCAGRTPFRRRMQETIPIQSASLQKRVRNVKTPKFPFPNGAEGNFLEMG